MPHQSALRKGRFSAAGQVYHVTICTAGRVARFDDYAVGRLVVTEMRAMHDAGMLQTMAWVLMPDHLHWLFALNALPLPRVLNRFKSKSARVVNLALGRTGALWQTGYHDRALRKEEDLKALARYVVANPVRAGLVKRVHDYPLLDAVWL